MKISYLLLGVFISGLVGCSPVTFTPVSSLSSEQSCSEQSGIPCDVGTRTFDKSLSLVIHPLGEPTSSAVAFVNTQDVTLTIETALPKPKEMILSSEATCQGNRQSFSGVVPAYTLAGTSGNQSVYVKVFSENKDMETDCQLAQVFLDSKAPVIQNPKIAIGKTAKDSVEVSFDALDSDSGLKSVQCSLKAQDLTRKDCLVNLSADAKTGNGSFLNTLVDGNYIVYVTAQDKAGNILKDFPIQVSKDTTAPVLTWVDTPKTEVGVLPYELKFKYDDGSGSVPKSFQCLGADGKFVDCQVKAADSSSNIFILSYPFPSGLSVADGAHSMGVKAMDQVGLWSNELTTNFNLDRSQPVIKLDPVATYLTTPNLTASFVATSFGNPYQFTQYTCEILQNGSVVKSQVTAASPCSFTGLAQNIPAQAYTIRVTGVKGTRTAQDSKTFNVDLTPPTVQIVKQPVSPTSQAVSTFQVSAADGQSGLKTVDCYVDRGTASEAKLACTNKVDFNTAALTEGAHHFEVVAEDQAGLKSTATYDWLIDLTAPADIKVTNPPALTINPRPTFEFVAVDKNGQTDASVDPAKGYTCTLDTYSPMVACVSPWVLPASFANLVDGPHKFYVQAKDKAGNSSAVKVYDFVVDSSAPDVKIFPKVADAIIGDSTTVNFTVNENTTNINSVSCFVDSVSVTCNVTGVGTKSVTGNVVVSNPNPTNGTARVVQIKAMNEASLQGQAQDTWNVNLGVNPFAKMKPALAVSQYQCVFCHTSMKADLITDNGASFSKTLSFEYTDDWGTAGWTFNDFEHGEWLNNDTGLSSSSITGTIYYQNSSFSSAGASSLKWWADVGMSSFQPVDYPSKTIVRKFTSQPSTLTKYADYLQLVTRLRTSAQMNAIKAGNLAGTDVKLAMPSTASVDPLQTQLQEVQNLKIGAPTDSDITSKIPTGREYYYIPDDPKNSPTEAQLLVGFKRVTSSGGFYYKVQGDLSCDGDLLVKSSVFLKAVNLKTRRGCRIYATGPIFIEAVSNRSGPTAGITFQDLSGEGLYNIQLSSASGISMGLGKTKMDITEESPSTPAALGSLGYRAANGFATLKNSKIYQVATQVIVDGNGNTLLEDAAYNPNATSPEFVTWQTDSTGKFITTPNRQVSFQRILLNAPMIQSRYSGDIQGSIVTGFLMPSLGAFAYSYDSIFQDSRVKVLPVLDLKNILYFQ